MAIFKSPVIASASGSVAGMTFSHNKGGPYIRARVIPTNPNTIYQQAIRTYVASLSNHWLTTLTDAQRDAWEVYASNVEILNALGDPINLTGLNHYIRSNVPRLQAAATRIDDAPAEFNIGEFTNPTMLVDSATDIASVGFTNTDAWANETGGHMFVSLSRPQNPSINFFKGPYRYAAKIDGDPVTPPTSPASVPLPFLCEAGQRIFAIIRTSRADGRLAASFRTFALAS